MLHIAAIHNFIDSRLIERRGIQTEQFEGLGVRVADGYILKCTGKFRGLPLRSTILISKQIFYVVNMGDTDLVLGMTWLRDIGEFTLKF